MTGTPTPDTEPETAEATPHAATQTPTAEYTPATGTETPAWRPRPDQNQAPFCTWTDATPRQPR